MLLVSRAICRDGILSQAVHAFAAAMELVMVVVEGHARLPERGGSANADDDGQVFHEAAPGVLLGDLLYTHAFGLVTGTGHPEGLACLAAITEDMVTAAIREVGASREIEPALSRAGCAGCGRLAALFGGVTGGHARLLRDLGSRFGVLLGLWQRQRLSCVEAVNVPATLAEMEAAATQCRSLVHVALGPSAYRDDLCRLVDFLTSLVLQGMTAPRSRVGEVVRS